MNNELLRASLEELHLELLQMPPAEKSIQDKRDALAAHLRETLAQDDLSGIPDPLKELFDEEMVSLEEAHPKVTKLILGIKEMLAAIGI